MPAQHIHPLRSPQTPTPGAETDISTPAAIAIAAAADEDVPGHETHLPHVVSLDSSSPLLSSPPLSLLAEERNEKKFSSPPPSPQSLLCPLPSSSSTSPSSAGTLQRTTRRGAGSVLPPPYLEGKKKNLIADRDRGHRPSSRLSPFPVHPHIL